VEEEAVTRHDLLIETPELEIRVKRLHKHYLGMEHDARQHLDVPPEHSTDDNASAQCARPSYTTHAR
jgi:hypothetical protein